MATRSTRGVPRRTGVNPPETHPRGGRGSGRRKPSTGTAQTYRRKPVTGSK